MESYRNFLAGWVREVLVRSLTSADGSKKIIVIAKVREHGKSKRVLLILFLYYM